MIYFFYRLSKFPTPSAPGVPGSGRGWALAAAAYSICWFFWFFLVVILYEIVYSFYRRWRFSKLFDFNDIYRELTLVQILQNVH